MTWDSRSRLVSSMSPPKPPRNVAASHSCIYTQITYSVPGCKPCSSSFRRGKGKRGGLRVVYYYWTGGPEFWLFTLYDKDETADLTPKERADLKERVKTELKARSKA